MNDRGKQVHIPQEVPKYIYKGLNFNRTVEKMSAQVTRTLIPLRKALNPQGTSQLLRRTGIRTSICQIATFSTRRSISLVTSAPSSVAPRLNTTFTNSIRNFTITSPSLGSVQDITSADDLEAKLTSAGDSLVVIDFYATWCGPCRVVAPMMEKLSQEYNEVVFLKVDVDSAPQLAAVYGITSMPTIVYIKNGRMLGKVVGANLPAIKEGIEAND